MGRQVAKAAHAARDRSGRGKASRGAAAGEPPLRAIERSLPLQLLKAREAAMARFRPMLRRHGLTEQQWRVIRVLAAQGRIDATELARRSFLLAPSLTRILRHLERGRVIARSTDREDQRRALFALTRKGHALFAAVAPDSERIYAAIERTFGRENLARLNDLLGRLAASLDEFGDS